MKTIIVIIAAVVLALGATSLWGRAFISNVGDNINAATPAEFDVEIAREAVGDLRSELVQDNRNLLALSRDIERTASEIEQTREDIDTLAEQIRRGGELLATGRDSFTLRGVEYTRSQIETQVETYINERATKREMLQRREQHLAKMRQTQAQMNARIAEKRMQVEDYTSQIEILAIDARFQSRVDRYNVETGSTEVQDIVDRLSDKVASGQMAEGDYGIDFVDDQESSSVQDMIAAELDN